MSALLRWRWLLGCRAGRAGAGYGTGRHAHWVRVGGRTCMADHFHDGSGTGPTRARGAARGHPRVDRLHGLGIRQPLGQLRRLRQQADVAARAAPAATAAASPRGPAGTDRAPPCRAHCANLVACSAARCWPCAAGDQLRNGRRTASVKPLSISSVPSAPSPPLSPSSHMLPMIRCTEASTMAICSSAWLQSK